MVGCDVFRWRKREEKNMRLSSEWWWWEEEQNVMSRDGMIMWMGETDSISHFTINRLSIAQHSPQQLVLETSSRWSWWSWFCNWDPLSLIKKWSPTLYILSSSGEEINSSSDSNISKTVAQKNHHHSDVHASPESSVCFYATTGFSSPFHSSLSTIFILSSSFRSPALSFLRSFFKCFRTNHDNWCSLIQGSQSGRDTRIGQHRMKRAVAVQNRSSSDGTEDHKRGTDRIWSPFLQFFLCSSTDPTELRKRQEWNQMEGMKLYIMLDNGYM